MRCFSKAHLGARFEPGRRYIAAEAMEGTASGHDRPRRVLMLVENEPFPQDLRVYQEATALTEAGYIVTVVAPRESGQRRHETIDRVGVSDASASQPPAPPGSAS